MDPLTGDHARGLALLWRLPTQPGRSGLSARSIVTAAVELADAEGLEAVAMRRVAERLGVGTMSLYTHVPGKAELTDLMVDSVLAELYRDVDEPTRQPGGWRGGLRFIAVRNWELVGRHPWLLQVGDGRPPLGPNAMAKYEAELRALDGIRLSDVEMDSALTLILTHVQAVARSALSLAAARRAAGQTELDWWEGVAPILERVLDGADFPVASRVGRAAGGRADPAHAFTFGLVRILDGIALLIEEQRGF